MRFLLEFCKSEEGQATEYMMAISVLVIAVVGATLIFKPELFNGLSTWGNGFSKAYGDPQDLPTP